jgi:PLP dependent protein
MSELLSRITDNVAGIRQQIAEAASRSGRSASDVTLVAVSKYVDIETAQALLDAGCNILGESRPQELWRKGTALADAEVQWHFIGHLQRNKVRRTLPYLSLLHACDSRRVLEEVNRIAADTSRHVKALLEVNISGDASKHGFSPDEMLAVVEAVSELKHIQICGLMGMASLAGGDDDARRDFERLRLLRDSLATSTPPNVDLNELSMGMSRDFPLAIEEGATIVRVGSALFDGLKL